LQPSDSACGGTGRLQGGPCGRADAGEKTPGGGCGGDRAEHLALITQDSVPASGGTATAWLTDPALAPDASFWLGANGLRFQRGAVWVSNTAQGTLLRIPVTATGAPGRIHTVTSSLSGVDDFAFLRDDSNVAFAAQNSLNQVAVVHPGGTTETVLTVSDGLASPTSVAVRGNRLYITDAGFVEPHDSKLQRGTINPRVPDYGKAG
jgi:hypothetical protein